MMSDFNKILYEQCDIELLTNCKISVKSVNKLNVYNFVRMHSDLTFLSYII